MAMVESKDTTTQAPVSTEVVREFSENMGKMFALYQQILQLLVVRQTEETPIVMDPLNMAGALAELYGRLYANPEQLLKYQFEYFEKLMELLQNTTARFMGENCPPCYVPANKDPRFRDVSWDQNIFFSFLKQSYVMTAEWMQRIVRDVKGIDDKTMRKLHFYTKQWIDAFAPSNFIFTNPEVLKTTLESHGENLVKGLTHLYQDLQHSKRYLTITTTDKDAFALGKNLAVTPGKVVYENDLMQLIHYEPLQKETYKRPLLIIPPWINKFYILDLRKENSFVRWVLEQGYSVFMISWVNPDKALSGKDFEDYMQEGPLAALEAIKKTTGASEINAIGYCLGGTLLTATLSYLKHKGKSPIHSATFFTTLVDFKDAGDLTLFVEEEQLQRIEEQMAEEGYLDGTEMANTFSILRANDMIWSFVVQNYLLGKDPLPFDLLYWNADSTRLPASMHRFYLRNMYQRNLLCKSQGITLSGVKIDVSTLSLPCYFLSTKEDHIAPWKATYATTQMVQGEKEFVLAGSGHIAGVINHPSKHKYGYWIGKDCPASPDAWLKQATENAGSWWPHWEAWLKGRSGEKIPAPKPGKGIEDAPGRYVMQY